MEPPMNLAYSKMIETRIKSFKEKDKLSKRNKELILKFVQNAIIEGVGDRRAVKYFGQLKNLAKWLGKDFDKVTREDIERVVGYLATSGFKEWTKWSYRVMIRMFWKWLEGNNEEYPDKVKWLKARHKSTKITPPEDLITRDDLKKAVQYCTSDRDRCIITLLYESGVRIGELLALKVKDIDFKSNPVKILVNAEKTKTRRSVPLIESVPYMTRWVQSHPDSKPESHLFVNNGKYTGREMSRQGIYKLIECLNIKLNNGKKLYPHLFRHSRATELANHLTEAQMNKFFGWTPGSRMAAVYVHLSGRDIDNAILTVYGQEKKEEKLPDKLSSKICSRCKQNNLETDTYCLNCGLPLDLQAQMEFEKQKKYVTQAMHVDRIKREIIEEVKSLLREEYV